MIVWTRLTWSNHYNHNEHNRWYFQCMFAIWVLILWSDHNRQEEYQCVSHHMTIYDIHYYPVLDALTSIRNYHFIASVLPHQLIILLLYNDAIIVVYTLIPNLKSDDIKEPLYKQAEERPYYLLEQLTNAPIIST